MPGAVVRFTFAAVWLCALLPAAAAPAQPRIDDIDRLRAEADRLASQQVRRAHDAIPLYRTVIARAIASGDDPRAAQALAALGTALRSTNQSSAAVAELERAVAMARRARLPAIEAEALRVLGILAIEAEQYDRAESLLSRGVAVVRHARNSDEGLIGAEIGILNSLSVGARHQGRLKDASHHAMAAQRLLDRAIEQAQPVPLPLFFQVPFNIGKSLADAGDYTSALTYFDKAFRAAEATANKGGQWHALYDTAEWYLAQGDVERAARYHERALALSRTMDSRDMEAHSLRGSGTVEEIQGNTAKAAACYTSALSLMDRIRLSWDIPETLVARARVRFASGDRLGAEQDARDALERAGRANEHIGRAHAHIELGRQRLETGRFADAANEYTQALDIARARGFRPLVPIALTGLGHAARRQEDLSAALRWYKASVEAATAIRGRIPSLELRTAFADASHSTFSWLIAILLELDRRDPAAGYGSEALLTLELERSQNLLQAMNERQADEALPGRSDPTGSRIEQLRAAVGELQTALLASESASNRNYLLARLDDAERTLAVLEGVTDRRSGTEDSADEHWRHSRGDIASMQSMLHEDETLVEFAQAGNQRVAFIIGHDTLQIMPLPEIDNLRERVDSFNRLLKAGMAAEAVAVGRSIARALVDPVLDRLPAGTQVLLLAVTGTPAAIPFAALPVAEKDGSIRPLVARYELAFVPSLSALEHLRRRPPVQSDRDLLALADPGADQRDSERIRAVFRNARVGALPFSGTEVQAIARYAANPDVLIGRAASESTFKARQGRFRILHFATHALVDPETPTRSALLLAASAEDDGLLQPREIHQQARRAEMVVLSACQSAGGRPSITEGVLSLARAFIYAGARSVVGSHWDVNDRSSAKLVDHFYGRLANGRRVAAALRDAQLEMAGPHPYATAAHWAGFMISGDPDADPQLLRLSAPTRQIAFLLGGVFVALVALFGYGLWRRHRIAVQSSPPVVARDSVSLS